MRSLLLSKVMAVYLRLDGHKVVKVTDYEKPEETGLPSANVLIYKLDNNETVIVRPSGTEPKIKFYFGVKGDSLESSKEQLQELEDALMKKFK